MASTQSKACCSTPAVISKGYDTKGSYTTLNGLKTYVTGPSDAKKALLLVYDIFGFREQTLQGADILASATCYKVFVPDFFEGSPADVAWYPPKDKETEEKLGNFFQTKAQPPATLKKIPGIVEEAGSFEKWGIMGLCWGGKITALSAGKGTLFSAAVSIHPAMVDPKDADSVSIPFALLASKDEPAEDVKKFVEALTVAKFTETYPTQIHGWMGARADLEDAEVKKEYERGYQKSVEWFTEHM